MEELIQNDPDWIYSKRYGNSVKNLLKKYPDGVPVRIIASSLLMTEEEVESMYDQIVVKLRNLMGVD